MYIILTDYHIICSIMYMCKFTLYMYVNLCKAKKKGLRFLVSTYVASIGIFLFIFYFAMKWCPTAVKCAGSIRILPCHVLNDFFTYKYMHIVVWAFTWFVRPLIATILCVWEIWSGSQNCVHTVYIHAQYHVFHWLAKEKITKTKPNKHMSPHWFWSRPMTRKQRLSFWPNVGCIIWTSASLGPGSCL